ncbi:hypothetical protein FA13DRAFT_1726645 [Coprinellus micaceus]|jgi:hypothetical protein|uniref:Uncharacterized protein n=1 Tax=Coprinellus micaceus TaxID=71717 RepID=A0A4Y7TV87_COPMI|nr:hypothetical protein FA13DRAFT_1726645 [Coprinellus micaceus]
MGGAARKRMLYIVAKDPVLRGAIQAFGEWTNFAVWSISSWPPQMTTMPLYRCRQGMGLGSLGVRFTRGHPRMAIFAPSLALQSVLSDSR